MSLYHSHRPNTFDQVVGNKIMVSALRALLATQDPPHAYMLTGPTGCGKTTFGRLIAAELGSIGEDFAEVDSADYRGIDTIRDMRREANYKALRGTRRTWLIDECHKLTNDAQNALLKGLEDPPSHCFFVLCTTEAQRVLQTIQSRCSMHQVKALNYRDMQRLLARVAQAEGFSLPGWVLQAVAKKASPNALFTGEEETVKEKDDRGVERDVPKIVCYPRHALMLLEKVLAIDPEGWEQAIGDYDQVAQTEGLAQALMKKEWPVISHVLERITDDNVEETRRGLLGYCRRTLLGTYAGPQKDLAFHIMTVMDKPFFDSGAAGFTMACYGIAKGF